MRDVFLDAELSNVKWNALSASESNNVFSSVYNKFNKLVNKHAPMKTTGVSLNKLKMAKIIPIFKANDNTDPNNYKPISLLCNFNRILNRKLIFKRVESFIDQNNPLSPSQCSFRKTLSAQHAILYFDIVSTIQTNIDKRLLMFGVFIDLRKAFDLNKLKMAKIIPIFKTNDNTDPNNYKPISLLCNFNRIFEKLIFKRVESFIEQNNPLSPSQCGFRKTLSAQHAILYFDIVSTIQTNIDKCLLMFGVFIDLRKAFDTVDHKILRHN